MESTSLSTRMMTQGGDNQFSPLLETLLRKRGIMKEDEREQFLNPNYERDIHDPFLFKDMGKAVERILKGITNGERIILYTDYDTDGIPAGVLLHDFFKKIEYKNFENYIPHRNNEGYGLNKNAITQFAKEGATLMITADCGITDREEVSYAEELGIDVILTDHHLPPRVSNGEGRSEDRLPPAYVVLNPKREDNTYPFDKLCGAGVAFKLVQGLIKRGVEEKLFAIPIGWEKWLLDMVGIATISDMVSLSGENRALAFFGLRVLKQSRRPGLKELLKNAGVFQHALTEEDVGFTIGPRLNAASRMDTPAKAFELLANEDVAFTATLAQELHELNEQRKGLVASILKETKRRISASELSEVIVIGNLNWNPGILGLVANHIVGTHERPAFVWGSGENGEIKGSCRSDGKVNIVELMAHAKDFLLEYGGHEHSGGFSLRAGNLHFLEEVLSLGYKRMEKKEIVEEEWSDGPLSLDSVTWNTLNEIGKLAPFGVGNPRPLFLFENTVIGNVHYFGKRKEHVKFTCRDSVGRDISAIHFFPKKTYEDLVPQGRGTLSFFAHVEGSFFRGMGEVRLRISKVV